jgi:hypothetical protein
VTGTITWAGHLTRRSPLRASSKSPQQSALGGGLDGRERHLGCPGRSARPGRALARCLPALIMLDGGLRDNRTADTRTDPDASGRSTHARPHDRRLSDPADTAAISLAMPRGGVGFEVDLRVHSPLSIAAMPPVSLVGLSWP